MPNYTGGGASVGSAQIVDNEIIDADINAAAAIAYSKLDLLNSILGTDMHESLLKTTTISISSAELKALFTTPKILLAAPGAGKVNVLERLVFSYTHGGTDYAGTGNMTIRYTGTTTNILESVMDHIAGATSKLFQVSSKATTSYSVPLISNQSIELTNATADYTLGNGTVKIFLKYRIVTL